MTYFIRVTSHASITLLQRLNHYERKSSPCVHLLLPQLSPNFHWRQRMILEEPYERVYRGPAWFLQRFRGYIALHTIHLTWAPPETSGVPARYRISQRPMERNKWSSIIWTHTSCMVGTGVMLMGRDEWGLLWAFRTVKCLWRAAFSFRFVKFSKKPLSDASNLLRRNIANYNEMQEGRDRFWLR